MKQNIENIFKEYEEVEDLKDLVEKRQRVLEGIDEKVIAMYSRGMTLEDIKEMIKEIYKKS